jgi:undecaprenyl-diphosphatase
MQGDAALLVEWALWAGEHALALFLVMLAFLLTATCVCWWILRRYTVPCGQSTIPSTHFMGLRIALGVVVMLAGVAVFAELAGQLVAGEALVRADQALTDALRASVPREAVQVFAAVTRLGDTPARTGLFIGVAIVLVALGRRWLALGWMVAVAGNGLLNQTLKQLFGRARPPHLDGFVLEQGFSFPSGHSSGSVVAYGMLAYLSLRLLPARWHLPTLVAAVALAFTVGASRVFLRVHFASDVIAGFASGAAWLAVCVTSIELTRWWRQRTA